MMLLANLQLKDLFDYYVREFNGGKDKREGLQTTKTLGESKSAKWINRSIKRPRDFLVEESLPVNVAKN